MKRKRGRKTCQKRYTISKRLVSGFDSGLGGGTGLMEGVRGKGRAGEGRVSGGRGERGLVSLFKVGDLSGSPALGWMPL